MSTKRTNNHPSPSLTEHKEENHDRHIMLEMSMNGELEGQKSLSQIYNALHNSVDLTSNLQAVAVKISPEKTITISPPDIQKVQCSKGSMVRNIDGQK